MSTASLRQLREDFVANLQGTSIWENFVLITPSCAYTAIICVVNILLNSKKTQICGPKLGFLLEFLLFVLPLVLNFTLFAEYAYWIYLLPVALYGALLGRNFSQYRKQIESDRTLSASAQKPFISYYRSIVYLITAICILAVDFKVFPRRLAKTETYGYGLMDTGVGFFIIANGLVMHQKYFMYGKVKFAYKTFLNVMPLLILGLIRLITTDALDYQLHVSEYGLHWNFFFTLAFVKFFSALLMTVWPGKIFQMTTFLLCVHQLMLYKGIESWACDDIPRIDFFTANREGLISLPGYLGMFLAAVLFGERLRRISSARDRVKIIPKLFIAFLFSLAATLISESYFKVSRRFANITYVLWMFCFSTYIVLLCFITELSILVFSLKYKKPRVSYIPSIIASVNYNGLAFFLVSNLLTGVVNILYFTLDSPDLISVAIIVAYMFIVCASVSFMQHYNLRLKL